MDCVCELFRGWMGKTKDLSAFDRVMVVGVRITGLSVTRTAALLGFSRSTVSRVDQEWSSNQRTSSHLARTAGSTGVNMGHSMSCGYILQHAYRNLQQYFIGVIFQTSIRFFIKVQVTSCFKANGQKWLYTLQALLFKPLSPSMLRLSWYSMRAHFKSF